MTGRIKQYYVAGFTIIELIVVVVIIGILATVVIVAYNGIQGSARDGSVLSDLDALDGIQTQYGLKNNVAGKAWYSGNGPDSDIDFTPTEGNVIDIVINSTDYCIRGYNPAGTQYKSLATAYKKGSTDVACQSLNPSSAALIGSPIENGAVVSFVAGSGTYGSANGTGASASFGFNSALRPGLAIDLSGNIYAADYGAGYIRKITPSGDVTNFGSSVYRPSGVVIDSQGNIYTSSSNANIRKITPAGVTTIFVGSPSSNQTGYVDANGTAARFGLSPGNLTIDSNDNIYVADSTNQKIRKITPAGDVTTFVAAGGSMTGITIDSSNNIYYINSGNILRKVTPGGVVTSVYTDGSGSMIAVTVDSNNILYIARYNEILKVTQTGVATSFVGNGTPATVDGIGAAARVQSVVCIGTDMGGTMYIIESGSSYRVRKIQ